MELLLTLLRVIVELSVYRAVDGVALEARVCVTKICGCHDDAHVRVLDHRRQLRQPSY